MLIIEALKILKDQYRIEPECIFAGTGKIEELKSQANGLNIHFTGWIDGEEKKKCLSNAGIFLLPSYHEGFPVSILEGMASGCYIIASDVGACKEIADGEFITPGDANALAKALHHVIRMEEAEYVSVLRKNLSKVQKTYFIDDIHKKIRKEG